MEVERKCPLWPMERRTGGGGGEGGVIGDGNASDAPPSLAYLCREKASVCVVFSCMCVCSGV